MTHALPYLAAALLVLGAGSAFAASPLGTTTALNPQPIPPGRLEALTIRKPPVCLSCPSAGLRLPGSDRMLNPQPLPPRLLGR